MTLLRELIDIPPYVQKGDFVRWRELTVTYTLPEAYASRYLRTRNASINFAARNLALWTKYRGIDPEVDRLAGGGVTATGNTANAPPEEFQTLGLPSYYTFRLNVGF